MRDECLIFGAGAIGRSVAGYAFAAAGLRPVFADVSAAIVNDLNARRSYRVFEGPHTHADVSGVRGVDIADREAVVRLAAEASYICTCTGERGIDDALSIIDDALEIRTNGAPLCVLFLENIEHVLDRAHRRLAGVDLRARSVSLVPTSVERMSKLYPHSETEFDVKAEAFFPIIFGRDSAPDDALLCETPELFMPVANLDAYYARKISTNNLGHAVLGYMGHRKGYASVAEAVTDPEIRGVLVEALGEAGRMLRRKYGFSPAEMDAHLDELVRVRFANGYLDDPIERVARDPVRKLSRAERLIGTALSCLECGIEPDAILRAAIYAMGYDGAADADTLEMNRLFRERRYPRILTDICGLSPTEPLYRALLTRLANTHSIA